MTLEALLRVVGRSLADSGIPFMITGSVAAGFRGAGRATMDVDAVIDPTRAQLADFVTRLEQAGLYVSPEAAQEAFDVRGVFNVIDPDTGWKANLVLRKARAFSEAEFARREPVSIAPTSNTGCRRSGCRKAGATSVRSSTLRQVEMRCVPGCATRRGVMQHLRV